MTLELSSYHVVVLHLTLYLWCKNYEHLVIINLSQIMHSLYTCVRTLGIPVCSPSFISHPWLHGSIPQFLKITVWYILMTFLPPLSPCAPAPTPTKKIRLVICQLTAGSEELCYWGKGKVKLCWKFWEWTTLQWLQL